eukprot:1160217-Pelagomonas_calceolata.AAC.10
MPHALPMPEMLPTWLRPLAPEIHFDPPSVSCLIHATVCPTWVPPSAPKGRFTSRFLMSALISYVSALQVVQFLKNPEYSHFKRIIFDTAPTGHTLRLLTLPDFLDVTIGKLVSEFIFARAPDGVRNSVFEGGAQAMG